MIAIVDASRVDGLRAAAGEECWILGELAAIPVVGGEPAAARTRLA